MTEKEYRSHQAISRSELWIMNESPEKFKWFKEHPATQTPALLFGRLVHKLLLEPDSFDDEFVIMPKCDRRTKEGKAFWDDFLRYVAKYEVDMVTQEDCDTAIEMISKLRQDPICSHLFSGEHEVPIFWTDEDTGEPCKCRLDAVIDIDGMPYIIDYKTAANAHTDIFNSEISRRGYYFQAAMYTEGVMHEHGLSERPGFIFVVQEKTAPYAINRILVSDDVMTAGLDKFRELIGTYHACKEMDYWYGYNGISGETNEAYLPGWMSLGDEEEE